MWIRYNYVIIYCNGELIMDLLNYCYLGDFVDLYNNVIMIGFIFFLKVLFDDLILWKVKLLKI